MMNILVVEDDEQLSKNVCLALTESGYCVESCISGIDAVNKIWRYSYDLVLLDIMLPGIDGFEVMKRIYLRKVPVMFMTARTDIKDKLHGFKLGAQDYLTKPFELPEMIARVAVVLKFAQKPEPQELYYYRNYCLDEEGYALRKDGLNIELKAMEFALAAHFIKNPGVIFSRDELIEAICGENYHSQPRAMNNHISQIRKKLGWNEYLHTYRNVGYMLQSEEE